MEWQDPEPDESIYRRRRNRAESRQRRRSRAQGVRYADELLSRLSEQARAIQTEIGRLQEWRRRWGAGEER